MTEKEKNVLTQELWALTVLDLDATRHSFEIMQRMLKCVMKDPEKEMTPNKRKVIEEIGLQWRFVKVLHENLAAVAERLGRAELVPAVPELVICDGLWDTGDGGSSDGLYEVNDKIADFQSAMQDCVSKLQEVCA